MQIAHSFLNESITRYGHDTEYTNQGIFAVRKMTTCPGGHVQQFEGIPLLWLEPLENTYFSFAKWS